MDWMHTLAWVIRGRGLMTVAIVSLMAAVYAHVPMQTEVPADTNAARVATR